MKMVSKAAILILIIAASYLSVSLLAKQFPESFSNIFNTQRTFQTTVGGVFPTSTQTQTCSNLIVGLYEPTTTKTYDTRSAATLLKGMNANFVMRGFFKFHSNTHVPLNYNTLQTSITSLKQEVPNLVYEGGITAGFLDKQKDTWANGTAISDTDFYSMVARDKNGNLLSHPVFPNGGYLGDLASPVYRKYIVDWAKKQIDAGVDAMFFDEVAGYAQIKIEEWGEDTNTVLSEYSGYYKMVIDELKAYAASKGRQFIAARNGGICAKGAPLYPLYPIAVQADDYMHCSFLNKDFDLTTNPTLEVKEDFAGIKANITKTFGREVPIIVFMDWAGGIPTTQLSRFATLSTQNQIKVLKNIDNATKAVGINFAYPIYGGGVPKDIYNKGIYDSTYFGTYDTIVQLATSSAPCTTTTSTTTIPTSSTTTTTTTSSTTTSTTTAITIANEFGVIQSGDGKNTADDEKVLGLINELGAQWKLISVEWSDYENDNSRWDNIIKGYRDAGIKVVIEINSHEYCIVPGQNHTNCVGGSRTLVQYSNWIKEIVARYSAYGVHNYQIENHANAPRHFWYSPANKEVGPPREFALVLNTSYDAIKSVDPIAKVSFQLGSFPKISTKSDDAITYLEGILKSGGKFDILWVYAEDGVTETGHERLEAAKQLMDNYGDIKPIWAETCEWGGGYIDSKYQTEQDQVDGMVERVGYLLNEDLHVIFWYKLKDAADADFSGNCNVYGGLVKDDLTTKKLAYSKYQEIIRGSPITTTTTTTTTIPECKCSWFVCNQNCEGRSGKVCLTVDNCFTTTTSTTFTTTTQPTTQTTSTRSTTTTSTTTTTTTSSTTTTTKPTTTTTTAATTIESYNPCPGYDYYNPFCWFGYYILKFFGRVN